VHGASASFYYKPNQFKRPEQGIIVLIVDNHMIVRRQQLLTDTWQRLLVQLLASFPQQVELEQIIGKHCENDLICVHVQERHHLVTATSLAAIRYCLNHKGMPGKTKISKEDVLSLGISMILKTQTD